VMLPVNLDKESLMQELMKITKNLTALCAAVGLTCSIVGSARAVTQFVQNGSFETVTGNLAGGHLAGPPSTVTADESVEAHWTNGVYSGSGSTAVDGYNFVVAPGKADTTGSELKFGGQISWWGPHNGGAAGNNMPATSPDGGYYLAMDGAFEQADIFQTITGLTVGQNYAISFWFAGAQQADPRYVNPTTDSMMVGLNDVGVTNPVRTSTATINVPGKGFSPWAYDTIYIKADNTTEVLSFLAAGSPNGMPPFALLDGVSMVATPEPSSVVSMLAGVLCLSGIVLYRRRATKFANKAAL